MEYHVLMWLKRLSSLSVLCSAAILLLVFRAWSQDISMDEANTYRFFVAPLQMGHLELLKLQEGYWSGYSNNHLLATLLISASTAAFGVSPITLRLPALLAAALYCVLSAAIAERLCGRTWRATVVFVLLVFNPLVLDNLVAARGYAIALACEMGIVLLVLREPAAGQKPLKRWLAMSVLGGVAVTANYTFGFTMGALLFAELAVRLWRRQIAPGESMAAATALFIPAAVIVLALCLDNLRTFQMLDMQGAWGIDSLAASFRSLAALSFNPANPLLTPPHLRGLFDGLSRAAPWIALVLAIVAAGCGMLCGLRAHCAKEASARFLLTLVVAFAASVFLFLLLHWIFGLKLPYSRTTIHWVPLLTLLVAAPLFLEGMGARLCLLAGRCGAGAIAALYLASLHTAYFMEWPWDADSCSATSAALRLADRLGVERVYAAWEIEATSVFYAERFGNRPERVSALFENDKQPFAGTDAKVFILTPRMLRHIDTAGLTTAASFPLSGVVVAVRDAPHFSPPQAPVRDRIDAIEPRCTQHRWHEDRRLYPSTQCEAAQHCW